MKSKKSKTPGKKNSSEMPDILKKVPIEFLTQNLNYPLTVFDGKQIKLIYFNQPLCKLISYTAEELNNISLDEFLAYIHAKDLAIVVDNLVKRVHAVCKKYLENKNQQISFSINYRLRRKDGVYVHVLVNNTVLEWDGVNEKMVTLNVFTDVTNHKKNPVMHFQVSTFNAKDGDWKIVDEERFHPQPEMLTKRENEIMKLMVCGKTAEEISTLLFVSFFTVRAHWRNILEKTNCSSQADLKDLAQREGWV